MDAMGIDAATGRMKPQGPVGVKPREFIVQVATGVVREASVAVTEQDMEDVFRQIDRTTAQDMLPLLRLLPGAMDLLEQARRCRVSLAVVSTDITERAGRALRALGIDGYFTASSAEMPFAALSPRRTWPRLCCAEGTSVNAPWSSATIRWMSRWASMPASGKHWCADGVIDARHVCALRMCRNHDLTCLQIAC